jgi:serine/threonine protein kinase
MTKIPEQVPWKATGKTLGGGGQAVVHEVEPKPHSDYPPGRYAMKIVKRQDDRKALARFYREIFVLGRLRDPRLVQVVSQSADSDSFHYFVMPLYEDYESLDAVAFSERSPFYADAHATLSFLIDTAECLALIHKEGVVHRDIKPGNVLVHKTTRKPLVLDFGCCQISEGGESVTLTDEGVGTRNYLAPECEAGAGVEPDGRADIYSLGKLCWSMLTRQQAFARERPAFSNKSMRSVLPGHSACWHMTELFRRMIRRSPNDRFKNCAELAAAARELLSVRLGRYAPLDVARELCFRCGNRLDTAPPDHLDQHKAQMSHVFGNPNPPGVLATQCPHCGLLFVEQTRVLNERDSALLRIE